MSIFRSFRRLLEALELIAEALVELVAGQRERGPAIERLDALERSRHQFEAEAEGLLLKAEGKLKAASNAEARQRQLARAHENQILDGIGSDSEAGPEAAAILPVHAPAGEGEGVLPLRVDVEANTKAHAVRAKFGI